MTFWNEGIFVQTAPLQEVSVLLKSNNSKSLGEGLSYVRKLTTFDHQVLFQEPAAKMQGGRL